MNVTVLDPTDEPKFVPVMVTDEPTAPDVGLRLVMAGPAPPPPLAALKAAKTAPQASDVAREELADATPALTWI